MNTDKGQFEGMHSKVSAVILRAYFDVYNELGSGFLESVYQAAMESALSDAGLNIERQVAIPVTFRGKKIANFCADLIVEAKVLLELKAVQALDRSHHKQVLNYLKATPLEVGFLLNFGPKPEFKRFVFDNEQKKIRVTPCESVVGF
jgi:GxxExxY protein